MATVKLPNNDPTGTPYNDAANNRPAKPQFKGAVKPQKKSAWKRFGEAFIQEDLPTIKESAKDYVVNQVIVPTVKNMIANIIKGTVDTVLFGRPSSTSSTYTSYNKPVSTPSYKISYNSTSTKPQPRPERRSLETYYFDLKEDADAALDYLRDCIVSDGLVTVGSFYTDCLRESNVPYTYEHLGWRDLVYARVKVAPDNRWMLDLPKPERID